jgi:hypothetical protein
MLWEREKRPDKGDEDSCAAEEVRRRRRRLCCGEGPGHCKGVGGDRRCLLG